MNLHLSGHHLDVTPAIRDYITGSKLSGAPGRNHVLPTMGFVFHF